MLCFFLMSWLRCLVWLALSYTSLKYFLWATFESFGCSFCKCCWFYLQTPTYQGIVTSFLVSFEIYFFLFISATIFTAFNNSLWIATTHHIFLGNLDFKPSVPLPGFFVFYLLTKNHASATFFAAHFLFFFT